MKQSYHSAPLHDLSFLVTGGAGFIGSHLVEYLVAHDAGKVVILDDLSTGFRENLASYKGVSNVEFIEGDIRDPEMCANACKGVDYILHQAALGSVPRSIAQPLPTHQVNATGFINILQAAKEAGVKRVVYASSSSVYGDSKRLPKVEEELGSPLSPYAVSKRTNELYARVFADVYGMEIIGLRYFNIFGPRQNPAGPYAAAIPIFIDALLDKRSPRINGDGSQTRDFTYVENAVQANIRALFAGANALGEVYNVAGGKRIEVNALFDRLKEITGSEVQAEHGPDRKGDVRDSHASISLAGEKLGYEPEIDFEEGLRKTVEWFLIRRDQKLM